MKTTPRALLAALAAVLVLGGCSGPQVDPIDPASTESYASYDESKIKAAQEFAKQVSSAMESVKYYKGEMTSSVMQSVDKFEVDLSNPAQTRVHRVSETKGETSESYEIGNDATYIKAGDMWVKLGPPMPPFDYVQAAVQFESAELNVVGPETINGVETKHYRLENPYDDTVDVWVDEKYRIIKMTKADYEHLLWDLDVPVEITPPQ